MIWIFWVLFILHSAEGFGFKEKDLVQDLLKRYDKRIKPGLNVTVFNRMTIYNLVDVDELHESIKLLLWSTQSWTDRALSWTPKDYGGIEHVTLPANSLWLPDWHIFNLIDSSDSMEIDRVNARVTFDGKVMVDFYKLTQIRCNMRVLDFPFDTQTCRLHFGSWSFSSDELKFVAEQQSFPQVDTSEWSFLDFNVNETIQHYSGVSYQELNYYLSIKRKPHYFVITIIVPTFFIVMVSLVGLFVPHAVGSVREEKVTFGLTTLLTLSIMLQMLSTEMPRSSEGLPVLGWYIVIELAISVWAMLFSVGILFFDEYTLRKEPWPWVRRIFEGKSNTNEEEKDAAQRKPLMNNSHRTSQTLHDLSLLAAHYLDKRRAQKDAEIWHKFLLVVDFMSCVVFIVGNTIWTLVVFSDHLTEIYTVLLSSDN